MYDSSTRLLTILHLLHAHGSMNAEQLAACVEVSTRTVRRYITQLRDLGIIIEVEMGPSGGYRLGTRHKGPPSLFTRDEIALLLEAFAGTTAAGSETGRVLVGKLHQLLTDSE